MVPYSLQCDPEAFGSPEDWNARVAYATWNRRQAHQFEAGPFPSSSNERLADLYTFLNCRSDSERLSLALRFAPPLEMEPRWFGLPWLPLGRDAVTPTLEAEGWVRAWHGTKLEALYSQILFGRVFSNSSTEWGERFVHKCARSVLA